MTKQDLAARRDYFNLVHGVTVRALDALSDRDLDFRPKPGMRTPRELIFHVYTQEKTLAEAVRRGEFTQEMAAQTNPEDPSAAAALAALPTVAALRAYANDCHDTAERIFRVMSEDDVARQIASPFGAQPAWKMFEFAYDEHWHHRGQLYTYLRLLGKEPLMLYDYQ